MLSTKKTSRRFADSSSTYISPLAVALVAVLLVGQFPGHAPELLVGQPGLELLQHGGDQGRGGAQVVYHHLQHEALPAGQGEAVQVASVHLPANKTTLGYE